MNKDSKIYVAGHTGMLGSSIVRKLYEFGYKNLLLFTRSQLDLTNQVEVKNMFEVEKPEYVFLASANVGGIKKNIDNPVEMLLDNLKIQNNVIENSFLNNAKRLLFFGSSCIFPRLCEQPMKEEYFLTGPFEPTNEGYALAKSAGLRLCEYYNREYKTQYLSVMPCNLYGYNDHYNENGHVISSLISKFHYAKVNKLSNVVVWGSGNQRREFLFVDDLADASIFLINNYFDNSFINIGSGIDYSIKEISYMLKKIIGYEGEIVFDKNMPDGMPRKLLDVKKLNSFGWKSKIDILTGLRLTYEDFCKHYCENRGV